MSTSDSRRAPEVADLARMLPVPAERDLPAGREHLIKEHLMAEFRADYAPPATAPRASPPSAIDRPHARGGSGRGGGGRHDRHRGRALRAHWPPVWTGAARAGRRGDAAQQDR